ncbi:toll/interleukin-1 receptor domain-containing protein [Kitasatospora sp. GP82]|uniref:toll/interleukin-1 receptor domain-containing protein n=1 Tax=Kitasatospora sp. GP82 TaxID=3035089 RepID=UPI002474AE08|nr:toll/interleukin-1 receptor domain-containing protein [Kitasatospora sp. GP82]
MTEQVSGFFLSYTRRDNEYDHGRILRLAGLIEREYTMATGRKLDVFIDKTHIAWGDDWRDRLNRALNGTAFFIPIITPGYFRSRECRRELLTFFGNARSLGVQELVLPILYVATPELEEENPADEAVALIKRMQREDWRQLRFEAEESPEHRKGIARLVNRLVEISAQVGPPSAAAQPDGLGDLGGPESSTIDTVAGLELAIPRWGRNFQSMYQLMEEMAAASEEIADQAQAGNLDLTSGAAVAKLAVLRRYAEIISGPSQQIFDLASVFASEAIELDPGVLVIVRNAEQTEPATDFVEYACELILTIIPRLRQNVDVIKRYGESMSRIAGLSKVMHPPVAKVTAAMQRITDGMERLEEWQRRVSATGRVRPKLPGLDDD